MDSFKSTSSNQNTEENDNKFTYYYGAYNHHVHYQPFMEFDIKDMKRIVGENGEFTNYITK